MSPAIDFDKDKLQFSWATAAKVVLAIVGGMSTLISFVIWLTTMHNDLATLRQDFTEFRDEARYHWRLDGQPPFPTAKPGMAPLDRIGMVHE